ncbi:MAG: hypothetical protein AAFY22_09390 [Pseudomonadota bacterium]
MLRRSAFSLLTMLLGGICTFLYKDDPLYDIVRTVIAVAGFAFFLLLLDPARAQMADRAESAVDAVRDKWEDAAAVERHFSSPLNGGGDFSSFDDSASFSQPMACLSSEAFLEIFFAPGAQGDLDPVIVAQDTDFDGLLETTQTLPAPVSGVCANGIVSCAPGTWNGCEARRWTTDPSNRLTLSPAPLDELGGCYCVNDSCGANLAVLNEQYILNDLAGGMAGALSAADPRFAVSTVGKTPFQISLSGQSTTACKSPPELPQTVYASAPSQLGPDAAAMSASDPVFSMVTALPAGTSATTIDHACAIEKLASTVDLATDVVKVSGSGEYSISVVSATEFVLTLGRPGNNYLNKSCNTGYIDHYTIHVEKPSAFVSAVIEDGRVDDDLQLHHDGDNLIFARRSNFTNYVGDRPGECDGNKNDVFTVNEDISHIFTDGAPHDLRLRTVVGGKGERFLNIRFKTKCAMDRTLLDGCAAFAADASCQLRDETADGVVTYSNGAETGLTPIPSTRTIGVSPCQFTVTEPWWRKDRAYRCTALGGGSALPTPDLDRATYIYSNSTASAWADQYTDADGNTVTAGGALNPPEPVVVDDCQQMCKVTRAYQNTHLTATGTAGDLQDNRIDTEFTFHACSAGVCPAGPGETVVEDCGCLDNFPEAMVMMQAIRLGSRDLICTTDTPVPY